MELPFLPVLKSIGSNITKGTKTIAESYKNVGSELLNNFKEYSQPVPDKVRAIDVLREVQNITSKIAPQPTAEEISYAEKNHGITKTGQVLVKKPGGGYAIVDPLATGTLKSVGKNIVGKVSNFLLKEVKMPPFTKQAIEMAESKLIAPTDETVSKLIKLIKEAKPVRQATEELYTAARTEKAGVGTEILRKGKGEAGFTEALSSLRGELPKANYESVKGKLTQTEIDALFDKVKNADLNFFDKINTGKGLFKILDRNRTVTPNEGELKLLQKVFGTNLVETILKKKPFQEKLFDLVSDLANVPRTLMSSIDLSAVLRQGAILSTAHPTVAAKNFVNMLKYFGSNKIFQESMESVTNSKLYPLMKEAKLYIADPSGQAIGLNKMEERFMSNVAGKIPLLGRLVKASERAYVGFLNKMRADVFENVSKEYMAGGLSPSKNPEVYRKLADFINNATGRGSIGVAEGSAPLLNGIFFSPRFMASRVQLLNPFWYAKMPPAVRKTAAKDMVKFVATGLSVIELAKLGGAKVETNPLSTDFGKIKVGNVRYDIWAGFQQWIRFTAQLITGKVKSTATGEVRKLDKTKYPYDSRLELLFKFGLGKLAPVPGLAADLLRGQDIMGNPMDIKNTTLSKFVPIYIQDILEALKEEGLLALPFIALPGLFGIGTQVYKERENKTKTKLKTLPTLPKLPSLKSL